MVKKLQGLNIIKILACMIIMCHHYQQLMECVFPGKINFYNGNFYFGFIVELFFMVSGILAYHVYSERGSLPTFTKYMSSKFMRFFPICFLSLTFMYILEWLTYFITGGNVFWELPTIQDYFLSIFFLDAGWGFNSLIVEQHITWYICVLLIMYALFWCICMISEKCKINIEILSFFVFILGCAIRIKDDELLYRDMPVLNQQFCRGAIGFYLGIIVYICIKKQLRASKIYGYTAFIIIVAATVYDYLKTGFVGSPLLGSGYWPFVIFLYSAIIIIAMTSGIIGKISAWTFLDKLEALTFPVYLWHMNFLLVLLYVIQKFNLQINHGYKSMLAFIICTFLICIPIHNYIDIPFGNWVKKLFTSDETK